MQSPVVTKNSQKEVIASYRRASPMKYEHKLPQHSSQTPRLIRRSKANITQKGQNVAVQSQATTFSTRKVMEMQSSTRKTLAQARKRAMKLLQSCLGHAHKIIREIQPM